MVLFLQNFIHIGMIILYDPPPQNSGNKKQNKQMKDLSTLRKLTHAQQKNYKQNLKKTAFWMGEKIIA